MKSLNQTEKKQMKINQENFDKERERITRYLDMIKNRKMSTYECISILEDLGVIEDTGDLDKYQIIEELGNHLSK